MTIPPRDAWVLARLLSDRLVNGELAALPAPWKAIGARLAASPIEGRARLWDDMTTALPDREGIIKALSSVDPDGPQPSPEETVKAVDSWGPLRIGEPPRIESFPIDAFPRVVVDLVSEGARAIGCPPDFLAAPVLPVAGGAIGRSASLMLKSNYFAPSTIWAVSIGPPSDGKTPTLKIAAAPLRGIDGQLALEYEQAIERWKAECEQVGSDGQKVKPPAPPKPRRIDVDGATMEMLPILMSDNPRGLVLQQQEFDGLMLGIPRLVM